MTTSERVLHSPIYYARLLDQEKRYGEALGVYEETVPFPNAIRQIFRRHTLTMCR